MCANLSDIEKVIADALREHYNSIPNEEHEQHHDWVAAKIAAETDRSAAYKEIRKTAIQWSVVGLLGYIFTNLNWNHLVTLFSK